MPDDFLSQYLPGTCSTSTRQHVIKMTWMSLSTNVVYPSGVCGKYIETVAWSYPQRFSLLHSPLDLIHVCGRAAQPYISWQMETSVDYSGGRKKLQHNKRRLIVLTPYILFLTWILTALTGTRACRAARGWRGRTRMCMRWNRVYPFPDRSHSAAPWTRKMPWSCRLRSPMSITGLMVTFLRSFPKSPCPLLLIQ